MHCSQHARNELVNSITLLHQRYQRRDSALIVSARLEMRENELLKRIDLVLQSHKIGNGLISTSTLAFPSVYNTENTHPSFGSLIVFKLMYSSYSNNPALVNTRLHKYRYNGGQRTIELGVVSVETQLRLEEEHIFANQRGVSYSALSTSKPTQCVTKSKQLRAPHHRSVNRHTSNTVTANSSHQAIDPIGMLLRLAHDNGVAFLENLMNRDESLERLHLVGKDGLPVKRHVSAMTSDNLLQSLTQSTTYTFMPAQNAADDL